MKRIAHLTKLALLVLLTFAHAARANDWPQWGGPDRNAVSQETGLLQEWPESGPPLAWRIDGLGGGYSAPSVADGRIFGLSNRGDEEVVWALDESNGEELWARPVGPANREGMPQGREGAGCTPTVDGDRLYVLGANGTLACLSVADGEIVWRRSMTEDFDGQPPTWRYNESPLIDGDKLICTPGGDDAVMVALEKATGDVLWKTTATDASSDDEQAGADQGETRGGFGAPAGGGRPDDPSRAGPPRREPGAATAVTGAKDPGLFGSEHWGMSAFAIEVPNGKYLAKLYFAETFDGITGLGQRVFSFNAQGQQFNDFDIWEKTGGPRRAYVESVPVEVTNGEFRIEFTAQVENPAIKAVELIPQLEDAAGASSVVTVRINAGASEPFTDSSGQVWQPDKGFEGGSQNPGFGAFAGGFPGRGPAGGGGRPGGFGGVTESAAAYASAIAIDHQGIRQYVQLTAKALVGVAADSGKVLWQYERAANRMGINCSTPVYHDGLIFAASAYGNGGGAVKLKHDADGDIEAEEVYFARSMQNHHGGMIVVDDCLYGASGGNEGGCDSPRLSDSGGGRIMVPEGGPSDGVDRAGVWPSSTAFV